MPDIFLQNNPQQPAKIQATQQLNDLVKSTNRTIFQVTSVFPFDLFPDKIILDEQKINIIYNNFFYSRNIIPIFYKDIKTVLIYTNILFGQISFELFNFKIQPPAVKNLWKSEAVKTRKIILGMVAAVNKNIDILKIPQDELLSKVEEIGAATDVKGKVL